MLKRFKGVQLVMFAKSTSKCKLTHMVCTVQTLHSWVCQLCSTPDDDDAICFVFFLSLRIDPIHFRNVKIFRHELCVWCCAICVSNIKHAYHPTSDNLCWNQRDWYDDQLVLLDPFVLTSEIWSYEELSKMSASQRRDNKSTTVSAEVCMIRDKQINWWLCFCRRIN